MSKLREKTTATLLIILFLTSMAFIAPIAAVENGGIVGLWDFDEGLGSTASDSSGYDNHGTLSGGKFGNALSFDGDNDYVLVSDDLTLRVSTFTIEAWIYPRSIPDTWPRILHKGNYEFDLYVRDTNLATNIDGNAFYSDPGIITLNEWQHVAVTCDGYKVIFYRNNEIIGETVTSVTASPDVQDLYIGNRGDLARDFDGKIDEVRISDFARTGFDLTEAPSADTGTVALWHFDESYGLSVSDSSGSGNNGELYGDTSWAGPTWTTQGLQFDGVDDYVEIPHTTSLDATTQITVAARIKLDTVGGTIIRKGAYPIEEPPPTWGFDIQGGKLRAFIYDDSTPYIANGDTTLSTGTWYDISFTYDGFNIQIYLGGVPDGSPTSHTGDIDHTDASIWIGRKDQRDFFDGIIDELHITLPLVSEIDITPDTLNLKSNGQYITAYIELPDGYEVGEIDPSTVKLSGIPVDSEAPTAIGDYDGDGVPDLMVKFDRQDVKGIVAGLPDYTEGEGKLVPVELKITGELFDGTPFEGIDTIQVLKKG